MAKEKNRGITLVSLVITVVVLLILSAVAINLATDENGLFRKAGEAVDKWNNKVAQEEEALREIETIMNELNGSTSDGGTSPEPSEPDEPQQPQEPEVVAVESVAFASASETVEEGKTVVLVPMITPSNANNTNVSYSSNNPEVATVDANGVVTGLKYGTATITVTTEDGNKTASCTIMVEYDKTKVTAVVKEGNRVAPIPVGYVASSVDTENEISEGLVIYEKTVSITEVNSSNHATALTSCNQFVWIPVDDIDYMVMCKSNNKLADDSGNKTCDLEVVNGRLQCTNKAHEETATDLCGRVYAITEPSSNPTTVNGKSVYTYNMTFTEEERATQVWDASNYREPDIVNGRDNNEDYIKAAGISSGSVTEFESQLKADFRAMAESVKKYGGFYVARYEAGTNGASKKNQNVMVAGTQFYTGSVSGTYIAEDNMWYGIYNKLKASTGINKEAISSHMIWGCQYDQVIRFLSEDSTNEPFNGHTGRQLNAQAKTGSNPADEMSNIYDLEGNQCEFTVQANSTSYREHRGGYFSWVAILSGYGSVSSRGSHYPNGTGCNIGARASLYVAI